MGTCQRQFSAFMVPASSHSGVSQGSQSPPLTPGQPCAAAAPRAAEAVGAGWHMPAQVAAARPPTCTLAAAGRARGGRQSVAAACSNGSYGTPSPAAGYRACPVGRSRRGCSAAATPPAGGPQGCPCPALQAGGAASGRQGAISSAVRGSAAGSAGPAGCQQPQHTSVHQQQAHRASRPPTPPAMRPSRQGERDIQAAASERASGAMGRNRHRPQPNRWHACTSSHLAR